MLSFHVNCPSHVLSSYFDDAIDNAISGETFETHGVHLKLKRRGESFMNIDGDVIFINTIADIEVFKDIGLFSSEITGVIDINLVIKYDLSSNFKLTTKTEILNYKWVEKPQLEVGALNMPVGNLVELALQHYESIITAKIDASIVQSIDVQSIIVQQISAINEQLAANAFIGLKTHLLPKRLLLERPSFGDGEVHFKGGVVLEVIVSDHNEQPVQEKPSFEWITELEKNNLLMAKYTISDNFVKQIVTDSIEGQNIGGKPLELQNLSLITGSNGVRMNARISSPIEGDLNLSGNPVYSEANQLLEFYNADFHIKPEGLIYRLSAPLVNKFIEAKIQELFPVDVAHIISKALSVYLPGEINTSIADIRPTIQNIKLESFNIAEHFVSGNISVLNAHLDIKFKTDSN